MEENTMKIFNLVAILGALAWTPHIISVLKKFFTKPEIRIIIAKFGEIGFSTFGPVFNIRLAFSVKYHDIVVSNLKVRIIHESGEEKIFEWQGIEQRLSTLIAPDGSRMPQEKEHSVLAIKLNQKVIEERFIKCQETAFLNGKLKFELKAVKKMTYLKDQKDYTEKKFLKSEEMIDLYKYIKHSFSWKEGKYEAVIEIDSSEKFILKNNRYSFTLTSIDIEELAKNLTQVEKNYESLKEDKSNKISLNWRFPLLSIVKK